MSEVLVTPKVQKELLTFNDVTELYGFPRQSIYRYIHQNGFPRPRQLGVNSVRFIRSEVADWVLNRPEASISVNKALTV